MAATVTSKNIGDRLIAIAKKKSETPDNALNIFLDHCIKAFDISKAQNNDDYNSWVKDVLSTDSDYTEIIIEWMEQVNKSLRRGEPFDFFGATYEEMFQFKGKSSSTGQFFTPISLSFLMGMITDRDCTQPQKNVKVYDDCCGSGRLLLGHVYQRQHNPTEANKHTYTYLADDIDIISCKMTALNLMVHCCYGCVACRDVLLNEIPHTIYIVNETQVPKFNPVMSIRTLKGEKAKVFWESGGVERLSDIYDITDEQYEEVIKTLI